MKFDVEISSYYKEFQKLASNELETWTILEMKSQQIMGEM